MKFIWEESDIVVGAKYGRKGMAEIWMIGYRPDEPSDRNRVSISMSDGLVTGPKSKAEMAADLTKGGYIPEREVSLP